MTYTPSITKKDFKQLSAREKRVAIAEDVLLRVRGGILTPRKGSFFSLKNNVGLYDTEVDKKVMNTEPCEACAKGAIVCAWLGTNNKHTLSGFSLDADSKKEGAQEIIKTFGVELWTRLECLFEGWNEAEYRNNASDYYAEDDEVLGKKGDDFDTYSIRLEDIKNNANVDEFGDDVEGRPGDEKILRLLMNNLIKNKGQLCIPRSGKSKKKGWLIGS